MFERPEYRPAEDQDHTLIMRVVMPTISFYRFLYNTVGEMWEWVDRRKLSDEERENMRN